MNTLQVTWMFPKVTWSETMPFLCIAAVGTKNMCSETIKPDPYTGQGVNEKEPEPRTCSETPQSHKNGPVGCNITKTAISRSKEKWSMYQYAEGASVVPLDIHEISNHNLIRSVHKRDFTAVATV